MMYPLVRELAVDGIPVAVTCRVLKLARQPYYRWLAAPVTDAEWVQAHRADALFDAHREDPEFGYRFLAEPVKGSQTLVLGNIFPVSVSSKRVLVGTVGIEPTTARV